MFREFWVSYRQCCSDCVRVRGAGTPPRCGWSPWARLRAAAGEPVLAEVVVTDLVLGLAGEVGVADGDGVNVPRPVALAGLRTHAAKPTWRSARAAAVRVVEVIPW